MKRGMLCKNESIEKLNHEDNSDCFPLHVKKLTQGILINHGLSANGLNLGGNLKEKIKRQSKTFI